MMIKLPARNASVDFSEHGYVIEEYVGKGQFGRAYKVRFQPDDSIWLAKSIDLGALDEKDKLLSLQEAGVMQTLRHPGIVEWRESFVHQDTYLVIIMEFCQKGDLATKMDRHRAANEPIAEHEIIHMVSQLAETLYYIHSKNILHRDIKPSNIFLTESGVVKIGDFGISRIMTSTASLACTAVGTPQYMAPEMCENKPHTYKSDIWAFGCVTYEMAALQNAFQADSFLALAWAISANPAPKLPTDYSQDLQDLIDMLLHKNPECRPSAAMVLSLPLVRKFRLDSAAFRCYAQSTTSEGEDDWAGVRIPGVNEYASITPALQGGGLAARQRTELKLRRNPRRGSTASFRSYQFYGVLARLWRGVQQTFGDENIWLPDNTTFIGNDIIDPLSHAALKCIKEQVGALVSDEELGLVLDRLCLTLGDSVASVGELRDSIQPKVWQMAFQAASNKARHILRPANGEITRELLLSGFMSFDHGATQKVSRAAFRAALHIFFPELPSSDLNFLYHFSPKTSEADVLYLRLLDDDIFVKDIPQLRCQNCLNLNTSSLPDGESLAQQQLPSAGESARCSSNTYDSEAALRSWSNGIHYDIFSESNDEWLFSQAPTSMYESPRNCWAAKANDFMPYDAQPQRVPSTYNPVISLADVPSHPYQKARSGVRTVTWSPNMYHRSASADAHATPTSHPRRHSFTPKESLSTITSKGGCGTTRTASSIADHTSPNQQSSEKSRLRITGLKGYAHPLMYTKSGRAAELWSPANKAWSSADKENLGHLYHKQHSLHGSTFASGGSLPESSDVSTAAETSASPDYRLSSPNGNIVDLFKSLGAAFTGLRLREGTCRAGITPQIRAEAPRWDSCSENDWQMPSPNRTTSCSADKRNLKTPLNESTDPSTIPVESPAFWFENNSVASSSQRPSLGTVSLPAVATETPSKRRQQSNVFLTMNQMQPQPQSPNSSCSVIQQNVSPLSVKVWNGKIQHSRAVEGRAERTASCRIVSALSCSPSSPPAVEKGFTRLLEARRRSDGAMGVAMRTLMLSFHAQRLLLGRVSAQEVPAFTALIREGCLLLRGICMTLSQHRSTVDRFSRNSSGEESPWTSASSEFGDEQLHEEISKWTVQLFSALRTSPFCAFQAINQLKELLSCQIAFFASRQSNEHLKGNWEAARLFMGFVVARKSTAASMGTGIFNKSSDGDLMEVRQAGGGLSTPCTFSDLEANLLHTTGKYLQGKEYLYADQEMLLNWNRLTSATLTKLQSAAIEHINQLHVDLRLDLEDLSCSCSNTSIRRNISQNLGKRQLSLPFWSLSNSKNMELIDKNTDIINPP